MNASAPTVDDRFDWVDAEPGIRRRVLQVGRTLMTMTVIFQPGAMSAMHRHVHEQTTYVARGEIRMTVDGVECVLKQGDSILLRSDVLHGVTAITEAVLVDSFSPVRDDIVDRDRVARTTRA